MEAQISSLVARVILDDTGQDVALAPESPLISSGLLDSLSMVNLIISLQGEFGVQLDVADLSEENFESVRSIASLVLARSA